MKASETLIGGAEVKRRVKRHLLIRLVAICVVAVGLVNLIAWIAFEKRLFAFIPPNANNILNGVLCVIGFLGIISRTDTVRTCAHCGTKLTNKEVLSMPEGDCLCPHCGKPFEAKINPEEFNF